MFNTLLDFFTKKINQTSDENLCVEIRNNTVVLVRDNRANWREKMRIYNGMKKAVKDA